jgi:hypothetical protein
MTTPGILQRASVVIQHPAGTEEASFSNASHLDIASIQDGATKPENGASGLLERAIGVII